MGPGAAPVKAWAVNFQQLKNAMTTSKDRILLGEIASAHGIRGELLVRSFTSAPEDIAAYGPLEDEAGQRAVSLKVVRVTPKGVIARIDGVDDRTGAEKLKGLKLYVERSKLPDAGEDEYYHADLIGLKAQAPDGSAIGDIVAVLNFGAGDLLELRLTGQSQTDLVPLTKACVPTVDIKRGVATVILPQLSEGEAADEDTSPE